MKICAERESGIKMTVGELFKHQGNKEITITKVELTGDKGMTKLDSVLVENVPGELLIGIRDGWPPNENEFQLPNKWDSRIPAVGAVVKPGEERSLVLGLTSFSEETAYTEVKIVYKDAGGNYYEQVLPMKYFITPDCDNALAEDSSSGK
ncbi:hypothetical protein DYI25_05560 [Mesobacillus boroniphilus]|uniref:Uncharacterized protein n=2 Tax=Mesobacillus boroniphilus TaxID=308892 RepID=A0A944GVK7_9BACI|nr:hypothetical protein [Mesobacillus boroniphilus]